MNPTFLAGMNQGDWNHLPEVQPEQWHPRSIAAGYWVLPSTYRSAIYNGNGIGFYLVLRGMIGVIQKDHSGRWYGERIGANQLAVVYASPCVIWVDGSKPATFFTCGFEVGVGNLAIGVPTMPGIGRLSHLLDVNAEMEPLIRCFETVIASHMAAQPTWSIRTRAAILEMLGICFDLQSGNSVARSQRAAKLHFDRWDRLLTWLENCETPPSAAQIAKEVGLSVNACIRGFTHRVGITPQKYIQARRLARAHARLLQGASVKEAALVAGYRDQLYFSRQYRRLWGHAPSAAMTFHSKLPKATTPVWGHQWAPDIDLAAFVKKAYLGPS